MSNLDYRVAHLRDRLAAGPLAELGVRVAVHGDSVVVTGTVPSAQCRDEVEQAVGEALTGLTVRCDLLVAGTSTPDQAEELP
ncbi:BON domain-containing protein [Streptomyces sp. NPDC053367]|uniref:BON domain-containing protein n=1 Tax=Streptomyces sp. NPDC053367 TaxID=3365700 RepID=UPI0037D41057